MTVISLSAYRSTLPGVAAETAGIPVPVVRAGSRLIHAALPADTAGGAAPAMTLCGRRWSMPRILRGLADVDCKQCQHVIRNLYPKGVPTDGNSHQQDAARAEKIAERQHSPAARPDDPRSVYAALRARSGSRNPPGSS